MKAPVSETGLARAGGDRFRQLADAMPQMVWIADRDGATSYLNRQWRDYTGFESVGPDELRQLVHPDDLAALYAEWETARAAGTPYQVEFRLRRAADGVYRWHLARAVPVRDAGGEVVQWYGTSTDIEERKQAEETLRRANAEMEERVRLRTAELTTANDHLRAEVAQRRRTEAALRESEERFRSAFDYAAIGMALVAPDGRWLQVNHSLCELIGYAEPELLATTFQAITHPDDLDADLGHVRRVLAGDVNTYQLEKRYFHKGGHVVWILLSVSLVRDPAGGPLYFIAQIQDINARKRAEAEMRQAKDAAESASRAKSEFLANMSHEIRTPMNGIIGMTDVALDTELTPEQREYLGMVKSSAEALLTVIDDILDFSKIESGKLALEAVPFRPAKCLADTVRPLELRARQKGTRLALEVGPGVPETVVGDPGRLRQVLVNLVGNALKFTEKGEVVVRVGLMIDDCRLMIAPPQRPSSHPQSSIVNLQFSVSDTGIGIPADKLGAIFRPFEQADGSTTRKYGGTGLGLSISARLVEMMGGRIWVESAPGRGSTFHFTARFEAARGRASESVAGKSLLPPRPLVGERRLHVLLAEDNAVNQRVAVRTLEKQGHTVRVACDGRAALEAWQREGFDVVLMDVQMPEMDGFEATAAIRAREPRAGRRTPIIAMTAHALKGDRERCLAAGMDGYVSKPIRAQELWEEIRAALPGADSRRSAGVFDRADVLDRLDGNAELLGQLTGLFEADGPRLLAELRAALARGDAGQVEQSAHSLKGSFAFFAAPGAVEAAARLEVMGRGGDLSGGPEALAGLERATDALLSALASRCEERP